MSHNRKSYTWILFDADGTLFHFDAFQGLTRMFSCFDVQFTKKHYKRYQALNQALWLHYQNGDITVQELQHRRFHQWATRLQVPTQDLNTAFQHAMAEICTPLEGAIDLLNTLQGKVKLGMITNGFTALQEARLARTGLREHFEILVISEQVGIAKPHPHIFDHALTLMGRPDPECVLMVGDNLEADIIGGLQAGFDTCWLNTTQQMAPPDITPHYQVTSLTELKILLKHSYFI